MFSDASPAGWVGLCLFLASLGLIPALILWWYLDWRVAWTPKAPNYERGRIRTVIAFVPSALKLTLSVAVVTGISTIINILNYSILNSILAWGTASLAFWSFIGVIATMLLARLLPDDSHNDE